MNLVEKLKSNLEHIDLVLRLKGLWPYVPLWRSAHLKKEAEDAKTVISHISTGCGISEEFESYCDGAVRGIRVLDILYAPLFVLTGFYFKRKERELRSYVVDCMDYGRITLKYGLTDSEKRISRQIWKNTKRKSVT